jgi:hypothetical protein
MIATPKRIGQTVLRAPNLSAKKGGMMRKGSLGGGSVSFDVGLLGCFDILLELYVPDSVDDHY